MTDTEAKALALVNEVRDDRGYHPLLESFSRKSAETEALCRALEAHEAFRREVSDAIKSCMLGPIAEERLTPFILPAPDPLVVEAREICARVCEGWTDIPKNRAAAYRDGVHDDEADFAYVLNALRKANERPTHD